MIAVDTNVLVYAHRKEAPWYSVAARRVAGLAESEAPWGIPWPCIHEFLAIVTHPRIFVPPTPLDRALGQIDAWMESPSLVLLGEATDYWPTLRRTLVGARVTGPQAHDARIAAICIEHGVAELWSADRDFGRFSRLTVRNPLLGEA